MLKKIIFHHLSNSSTILAMFAIFAILTNSNAHAANLKVHVQDAHKSQPLSNIAVCAGTTADVNQFGAFRTDSNGNVTLPPLPNTSILLTVSGEQRKGTQHIVPLHNIHIDLVRVIKSSRGGFGPVCNAPAPETHYAPDGYTTTDYNLRITRLYLDKGHSNTSSRTVVLSPKIQGQPTHYRISEDPDFKDSEWQDYQKTPIFTLSSGEGEKKVFYQVRKSIETDRGNVQTLSNVISDWIILESP